MATIENRVEMGMKAWAEKEERYATLFSSDVLKSRQLLKEKLHHYDGIKADVLANPRNIDRFALTGLEVERKKLQRQLYPNILLQLLTKIVGLVRTRNTAIKIRQESLQSNEAIKTSMERAGFGDLYPQAKIKMEEGHREFSLPVSYQVSEHEKIKLELNFRMEESNKYSFHSYSAILHSGPNSDIIRKQTFEMGQNMFDTSKAYHLLAGRAVQQADGKTWTQLDFNDREADGTYRYKNFSEKYGFDLNIAAAGFPMKSELDHAQLKKLKNGDKVDVIMLVGAKEIEVSINANPQKKEFIISNAAGQPVRIEDLLKSGEQNMNPNNVKKMVPKQNAEGQKTKTKARKVS